MVLKSVCIRGGVGEGEDGEVSRNNSSMGGILHNVQLLCATHFICASPFIILTWRRKMRFREGTAHGHSANKRRSHNVSWL